MGNICIDPLFLDLGEGCRWVVGFTARPIYPRGKNRQQGGAQSRSEKKPAGFYKESPPKSDTDSSTTGL
jgi:hypothetical protein